jgi:hypothetical protein
MTDALREKLVDAGREDQGDYVAGYGDDLRQKSRRADRHRSAYECLQLSRPALEVPAPSSG